MIRITSRGYELKAQLKNAGLTNVADILDDDLLVIEQIKTLTELDDETKIAIIKNIRLHTPLLIGIVSSISDKKALCDNPSNKRLMYVCRKLKG